MVLDAEVIVLISIPLLALSFALASFIGTENHADIETFAVLNFGGLELKVIKPKTVGGVLVFLFTLPAVIFVTLSIVFGVILFKAFDKILSIKIR